MYCAAVYRKATSIRPVLGLIHLLVVTTITTITTIMTIVVIVIGPDNVDAAGNNAVDLVQTVAGYDGLSPFSDIDMDATLGPTEFIRSRKFNAEVYHITTTDGYILSVNRIVNPLVASKDRNLLKPVILQHGLLTSSMVFLTSSDANRDRPQRQAIRARNLFMKQHRNGRRKRLLVERQDRGSWRFWAELALNTLTTKHGYRQINDQDYVTDSLAFLLANQGYDVWMPNSRGTRYSMNHTRFDAQYDARFWEFSFHEHALFDLPACIDLVLRETGKQSVAYVGHSQGNQMMFILQSLFPEIGQKIQPFIAVAPIVFIPDLYFGLFRPLLTTLADPNQLDRVLKGKVLGSSPVSELLLDLVCRPRYTPPVCDMALALVLGDGVKRANRTKTAMLVHHIPDSTSAHNLLHFAQLCRTGRFEAFDYGPEQNLIRYGTKHPLRYPIENIVSRDIAFIWAARDPLATPKNVAITRSKLSVPLMDDFLAPDLAWGHSDFFYGRGAGRLINLHILSVLDQYD